MMTAGKDALGSTSGFAADWQQVAHATARVARIARGTSLAVAAADQLARGWRQASRIPARAGRVLAATDFWIAYGRWPAPKPVGASPRDGDARGRGLGRAPWF